MRYATDATIPVQSLFVDIFNNPIITAGGRLTIRRTSDDEYFNGTVFQVSPVLLVMSKISDVNAPGWFDFNFNTNGFSEDTYIFTVTDANNNAANTPQLSEAIVSDALTRAIEAAAAAGVGKVVYDETTSRITLFEFNDASTILFTFDVKDKDGNAAGDSPIFEKIPL